MRYEPDGIHGCHWVPLRIRDDKQTPQYFKIVTTIWNTINNPVTESRLRAVSILKI